MKKILIGLFLFTAISGYSQEVQKKTSLFGKGPKLFKSRTISYDNTDIDGTSSISSDKKIKDKRTFEKEVESQMPKTSGDYLKMASKDFITSGALGLGGTAIACSAIAIKQKEVQYTMIGAGGICGIIAIVHFFKGAINVGKAGEARKERGLSQIKPSKEGIGLNLSF